MGDIIVTRLPQRVCPNCGKLWAEKYLEEHIRKCIDAYNRKKIDNKIQQQIEDILKNRQQELESKRKDDELKKKRKEEEIKKQPEFWILEAVYHSKVPLENRDLEVAKRKINEQFGNINCTRCKGTGIWRGDFQVYRLNDYTCWKCWGAGKHIPELPSDNLKKTIAKYFLDKKIH